jgi:hypothetical protein
MASLAYRKNYKRKWISACRSLTKYDNSSKRVGVDETQNPPVAFPLHVKKMHLILNNFLLAQIQGIF